MSRVVNQCSHGPFSIFAFCVRSRDVGFPPALGLYEREGFYPCALVGFRVEKKCVRMCASSRCELESRPAPIFRRSICGLPRKKEGRGGGGRERVRRIFLAVCEKKYANVLSAGTHEDKNWGCFFVRGFSGHFGSFYVPIAIDHSTKPF